MTLWLDPLRTRRFVSAVAVALLLWAAVAPAAAQAPSSAHEVRFADQITTMLDGDKTAPPPQNGVLFIGSSIFRQWTNVKEHMAPLPAFNRAFGGSRTWEVLHYMDRIVLPYHPRIIVYYTGSNDVSAGDRPRRSSIAPKSSSRVSTRRCQERASTTWRSTGRQTSGTGGTWWTRSTPR